MIIGVRLEMGLEINIWKDKHVFCGVRGRFKGWYWGWKYLVAQRGVYRGPGPGESRVGLSRMGGMGWGWGWWSWWGGILLQG